MTDVLNTDDAFRPASEYWGATICPVAHVTNERSTCMHATEYLDKLLDLEHAETMKQLGCDTLADVKQYLEQHRAQLDEHQIELVVDRVEVRPCGTDVLVQMHATLATIVGQLCEDHGAEAVYDAVCAWQGRMADDRRAWERLTGVGHSAEKGECR